MKIFIDAGHNDNMVDTGATGNSLREQDINFAISYLLAQKLKSIEVDVKLSRDKKETIIGTDLNSSLSTRAKMANDWGADLFISIHCNSFTNANANGTETYTYGTKSKAYELSKKLCDAISTKIGTYNRGAKIANYTVLTKTSMPAILIETAFISNSTDAMKLKNNQEEIALAIFDTICEHYGIEKVENDFENAINVLKSKGIIGEPEKWKNKKWDNEDVEWLIKKTAKYVEV